MKEHLDLADLRKGNVARCVDRYHYSLKDRTPAVWADVFMREVREICDSIKKLNRVARSDKPRLVAYIATELADALISADLLAARLDIDLAAVVRQRFNEVSERIGSDHSLRDSSGRD